MKREEKINLVSNALNGNSIERPENPFNINDFLKKRLTTKELFETIQDYDNKPDPINGKGKREGLFFQLLKRTSATQDGNN